MTTTPEQIAAVFRETLARAEKIGCQGFLDESDDPCYEISSEPVDWCRSCLMRVAAEAWAERERCVTKTVTLATRKEQP